MKKWVGWVLLALSLYATYEGWRNSQPTPQTEDLSKLEACKGREGCKLTLRMPCYLPVLQYAHRRDLRARLHEANATRASDTELDVYKPERWLDDALFRPEVRAAFHDLVAQGWTDALRTLHPGERIYTFWDYFRNAWARDAGLRIPGLGAVQLQRLGRVLQVGLGQRRALVGQLRLRADEEGARAQAGRGQAGAQRGSGMAAADDHDGVGRGGGGVGHGAQSGRKPGRDARPLTSSPSRSTPPCSSPARPS